MCLLQICTEYWSLCRTTSQNVAQIKKLATKRGAKEMFQPIRGLRLCAPTTAYKGHLETWNVDVPNSATCDQIYQTCSSHPICQMFTLPGKQLFCSNSFTIIEHCPPKVGPSNQFALQIEQMIGDTNCICTSCIWDVAFSTV